MKEVGSVDRRRPVCVCTGYICLHLWSARVPLFLYRAPVPPFARLPFCTGVELTPKSRHESGTETNKGSRFRLGTRSCHDPTGAVRVVGKWVLRSPVVTEDLRVSGSFTFCVKGPVSVTNRFLRINLVFRSNKNHPLTRLSLSLSWVLSPSSVTVVLFRLLWTPLGKGGTKVVEVGSQW